MTPVLIVTRPSPDSAFICECAASAGFEVFRSPLIEIVFRHSVFIDQKAYQAVLVTSANGARALAGRTDASWLAGLPAVTVGPASTAASRDAGFDRIIQADGDVDALIAETIRTFRPDAGALLYASGAQTTGDLQRVLQQKGFDVDRVVLYEAVRSAMLNLHVEACLRNRRTGCVVLYSPRSAKIWCDLTSAAGLAGEAAGLKHLCLSHNVANVVRARLPDAPVLVSSRADDAAMCELIGAAQ